MGRLPLVALAFSLLAAAPAAPWLARPHTSVTPDGTWTSASSGSSGNNVTFTVTNNSASWESYSLSCDKSGLVSSCSPGTSSIQVGPNSSENLSVSFAVGTGPGTGQVSLTAVSDYFELCDPECPPDEDTGYYNVSVSSPPTPPSAIISFTAYPARRLDYGTCLAACFTALHAQSTVPYFSLDQARSLTLVYNEDRTSLKPFILVDVQHNPINPDTIKLQVKVNGTYVTFLGANEQTLRFTGGSGSQYHRIGGQIDASGYTNEQRHAVDVIVTSVYNTAQGGYDSGTVASTESTDLIVLSERASPIGRGWSIAGWQRLFPQAGGSVLIAEGDGSYTYFAYSGGAFTSPPGDFSRLEPWGSWYRRWYADSTRAHFNSSGQLVYLISRFSDTTKFAYDYLNRPYKITDPAGKETILGYGSYGLSSIRDPFNRYTYVTVTSDTVLTAIQDPDGVSTAFGYDGSKRLQTITDRAGKPTTLTYDTQSGKLASVQAPQVYVYPVGNRNPATWFEPWQKDGVPFASTASTPLAPVIWDSIDAFIRTPDSVRVRYRRFNVHGQANFVHQPLGVVDSIYYNAEGQVTDARTAFGLRSTFTYVAGFLTQSVVDGMTVNFRNGGWTQADSVWGDVTTQRRYLQGGTGLLDSVRLAGAAQVLKFTYGAHGRLFTAHDQEGHLTRRVWYAGANGNRSKDSLPGGRVATHAYDTYGRDTSFSQTGLPTRRVTYDVLNRPTFVYDGVYATPTQLAYDSLYLKSVTDAKGQAYQYVRDAMGRVVGHIDPAGRRDTTEYGWMGEVRRYLNRRGDSVTLAYDSLLRRTSRGGSNFTDDALTYSANGRVVTGISEATIETLYLNARGNADSVKTVFQSDTSKKFWRRYAYDARGRVYSVATTGSYLTLNSRGYSWNTNGTLGSLTLGSSTTTLGYNTDLRRDLTTLPGTSHTVSRQLTSLHEPSKLYSVAMNERYHYDATNRLDGANHSLDKQEWYTFDGLSRLDSVAFRSGVNFCYDFVEWLGYLCIGGSADSSHKFVYDSVGNRTDHNGAYGIANRIQYFDGCSYGTDYDGNVTSRTCSGDTVAFTWNALNQLTSYTRNGAAVYLRYDAFGQLVLEYGTGVTDQGFLWDRGNVFAAVNAGLTAVIAQYSYYPGLDRPHAVVVDTTQYYAHEDGLGSTKALTTSDKTIQRTYVYDEWGQLKGGADNAGLSGKDRARFKGAFWMGDGGVELYYMRNRWYEPKSGRFLSEDPIGLAGGISSYLFGGSNPVESRDPTGMLPGPGGGGNADDDDDDDSFDLDPNELCPADGIYDIDFGTCTTFEGFTYPSEWARFIAGLYGRGHEVDFNGYRAPNAIVFVMIWTTANLLGGEAHLTETWRDGSGNSLHFSGNAADFYVDGWAHDQVALFMHGLVRDGHLGLAPGDVEIGWYMTPPDPGNPYYGPHVHVGYGSGGRWGMLIRGEYIYGTRAGYRP